MANIHIARNHQSMGSFSEDEIREGIRNGRFSADDLAWREGMSAWKPLGEMAPQWGLDVPPPIPEVLLPDDVVETNLPGRIGIASGFFRRFSKRSGRCSAAPQLRFPQ